MNYQTLQMVNYLKQVMVLMVTGLTMRAPVAMLQTQEPIWVGPAWEDLDKFARTHGILYFGPKEALSSMIDRRIPHPVVGTLPEPVLTYLEPYKQRLKGPYGGYPPLATREQLSKFKAMLAGYHLIATGVASDQVVNDVYRLLKPEALEWGKEPDGMTIYMEEWQKRITGVAERFEKAESRADKVLAIDALVSTVHEFEPRWLMNDFFGEGQYMEFTPLDITIRQLLDIWFGSPWDGLTIVDLVELFGEHLKKGAE